MTTSIGKLYLFFIGHSATLSKTQKLIIILLTVKSWEFQNNALWDSL